MDHKKLSEIVNQSGFPLQIGVAHNVQESSARHGWKVLYTEHSWKNETDGTDGFIDIVLENAYGTSVMVLECKRVLDSAWIFLIPSLKWENRSHAKSWVTRYASGCFQRFDWYDLTLEPSCPESQYCVIPGQDAKSKPMIERIGAELVSATEGLAWEEKEYHAQRRDALRMYFSTIVTTAQLKVCSFDPKEISLTDGKVATTEFKDVPYVRFRKQLSTQPLSVPATLREGLHSIVRAKEHTVFIVNSQSICDFLQAFVVNGNALHPLL